MPALTATPVAPAATPRSKPSARPAVAAPAESTVVTADPVEEPAPEPEAVEPPAPPRPAKVEPPPPPLPPAPPPPPVESAPSAALSAPAPSASASAASELKPVAVKVGDTEVFALRVGTAAERETRARAASKALNSAVERGDAEIAARPSGSNVALYLGSQPIVELTAADAEAAGVASLEVYAAQVAASGKQAIEAERYRKRIGNNAFYSSLVVLLGLIAFYLIRKVNDLAQAVRVWLEHNTEALTVRVRSIELVRPEMLQSFSLVGVSIARWLGQLGIVYLWLITVLSFFESTRGYTEKLTGYILSPVSQLTERVATALPVVFLVALSALTVMALVRFVELLFASVARRETTVAFVPPDLAPAASVLLRFSIVVGALVFAAPVITGDPDGAFARVGQIALLAFGLASIPLLATVVTGATLHFGRRLRVGEYVELAGVEGRVTAINLLEVRLETAWQGEVRIPHLALIRQPVLRHGYTPRVQVIVTVASDASLPQVLQCLSDAASEACEASSVELLLADANGLQFRVSGRTASLGGRSALLQQLVARLGAAGIPLGRGPVTSSQNLGRISG